MKCDHHKEQFSDLLDERLSEAETQAVREHLKACTACREDYASFKEAVAMVSGLPRLSAPADFLSRMEKTIQNAQPQIPLEF